MFVLFYFYLCVSIKYDVGVYVCICLCRSKIDTSFFFDYSPSHTLNFVSHLNPELINSPSLARNLDVGILNTSPIFYVHRYSVSIFEVLGIQTLSLHLCITSSLSTESVPQAQNICGVKAYIRKDRKIFKLGNKIK